MSETKKILEKTFGFKSFRPGQEEVVNYLINKKNLLAIMPTGAGKSLCFQLPALLFANQTIVISPLVALMDDQVEALKDLGVNAERVHSGIEDTCKSRIWKNFINKQIKILYISPESLMKDSIISLLKKLNISMFVIDEAHCISKWGADFRKDYEQLQYLKNYFPHSIISAFTATADEETRNDINNKLSNGKGKVFLFGFNRPNLSLAVQQKYDWKTQLFEFLKNRKNQSGIIYCLSRKQTETVENFLNAKGFNCCAYHAGQESEIRKRSQDRFMTEDDLIMSATIAFGMGIDKSNVRFIVHISLPGSMEAFYQEIGRAGRDGIESDTLLIYGLDDLFNRKRFIEENNSPLNFKIKEHKRLESLVTYCESATCRRQTLLAYFKESIQPCGKCDNCLDPPMMIEGTEFAQMVMSAIYRTGQYFGSKHIIDVLRGSLNLKVKQRGHDKIKTFGIGRNSSNDFWRIFIKQLVSSNYLSMNIEKYGALEITDKGKKVLKGEEDYFYRKVSFDSPVKGKIIKKSIISDKVLNEENSLLASLKSLRLELAKKRRVPAYVVFSDATLHEMILHKPKNLESFGNLNGVGPLKIKKYGNDFLNVINKKD